MMPRLFNRQFYTVQAHYRTGNLKRLSLLVGHDWAWFNTVTKRCTTAFKREVVE